MGNPICHWELSVSDVEKAKAFYSQVFNWTFTDPGMGGYWLIDTGRPPGGGMMAKPPQAPFCSLTQYFLVDSVDETLKKVVAAGGSVVIPKTEISKEIGSFAIFADPDQIVMAILEPGQKA